MSHRKGQSQHATLYWQEYGGRLMVSLLQHAAIARRPTLCSYCGSDLRWGNRAIDLGVNGIRCERCMNV